MNETITSNNSAERAAELNIYIAFACVAACIIGGVYFKPLSFVALAICIVYLPSLDNTRIFSFLLMLFPFAGLFKLEPEGMSFFTAAELYSLLILMLRDRRIPRAPLIPLVAFSVLLVLRSSSYGELFKVIASFLLLSFYTGTERKNHESPCSAFVCGVLTSSFTGLFVPYSQTMQQYVAPVSSYGGYDRFTGLNADPNYYSISLILAIVILALRWITGRASTGISWLLLLFSVFFGTLTNSKSFLLMLAVVFVACMYLLLKYRRIKEFRAAMAVVAAFAVITLILGGGIFAQITERLISSIKSGDVTTGRMGIWRGYMSAIAQSGPAELLLGNGIGAPLVNSKGPHNIYIEILYITGVVGFILYFALISVIMTRNKRSIRRRPENYLCLTVTAMMYFFLGGLTAYDLCFQLMICYSVFNIDFDTLRRRATEVQV